MFQFKQIKETCIYCKDLAKAKDFYNGLLGLPIITFLPDKHLFLRVGTSVLLIFNPDDSRNKSSPPPHYATGKMHFAFEVSEQAYEQAKTSISLKGIPVIEEVEWKSGKTSFYFNDPEGNVLEILPDKGVWD